MNDSNLIHITLPNGHMVLVIDKFFPCSTKAERIVMPLIAKGSDKESIDNLIHQLELMGREFHEEAVSYQEEAEQPGLRKTQVRRLKEHMHASRNQAKRAERNLSRLEGLL
jgi:hypothetical protein